MAQPTYSGLLDASSRGDQGPLSRWVAENGARLDETNAEDLCLLEMAVALEDMPATLLLLESGASPNVKSRLGITPLHYCCSNSWEDGAEALINHNASLNATTVDAVTFMGQAFGIYTCGGRTPLHCACEALDSELVAVLVRRGAALDVKDNDGCTPLDIAYCMYISKAEAQANSAKERYDQIHSLLSNTHGAQIANADPPLSRIAVAEMRAAHQKRLQVSALKARSQQQQHERESSLAILHKNYTPLHADVRLSLPEGFVNPDVLRAIQQMDRSLLLTLVTEPSLNVFSIPFLNPEWGERMAAEVEHYAQAALRSREENPSEQLPLPTRHDSGLLLNDIGFEDLLAQMLQSYINPLAQLLMNTAPLTTTHAFTTRNWIGRDNAQYKLHVDKSDVTFNLCLRCSDDIEGSTVSFYGPEKRQQDMIGCGQCLGEEPPVLYEYPHRRGYAALHLGSELHKTNPILKGNRMNVIVWCRH